MFGTLVRAYRRRLSLTQEELAELSGLSVRSIRRIERGETPMPRATTVRLLADVYRLAGADRDRFVAAAHEHASAAVR